MWATATTAAVGRARWLVLLLVLLGLLTCCDGGATADPLPVSYYPFASGFTLTSGNLVGTVSLPAVYTVSFELYPTAAANTYNVIHLTSTGADCCNGGDRLPGLWLGGAGGTSICTSATVAAINSNFWSSQPLPLNAWSRVTVTMDLISLIMTTNTSVFDPQSISLPTPTQSTQASAMVYVSDPWYAAAPAKLRNLVIKASNPAQRPRSVFFGFTSAAQTFVVPENTSIIVVSACGGGNCNRGGYISSFLPATPGTTLYVYAGGGNGNTYNGGGGGWGGPANGAGASDVRTARDDANSRLVVAGGSGGSGCGWAGGGAGGGSTGASGSRGSAANAAGGGGGPNYGGGGSTYNGQCGHGGFYWGGSCGGHSGGGGGWYGGGAGWDGGGGGSSYTAPSGTVLVNNQGDGRCNGYGWLTVEALQVASLPVNFYPSSNPFYGSGFAVTSGTIAGFFSLPSSYSISVELFPVADGAGWRNIFYLSPQIPGLWLSDPNDGRAPGSSTMSLFVDCFVSSEAYIRTTAAQALPLNQWSTATITIDVINKIMTLSVTGGLTLPTISVPLPTASQTSWSNVILFASDPWHVAARSKIRDLVISMISANVTVPLPLPVRYYPASTYPNGFMQYQGDLIGVVSLPASYSIIFELFPTVNNNVCRNILTLTATFFDDNGAGACLPAIFFCNGVAQALHQSFMGVSGVNNAINPAQAIPLNAWSTIMITVDTGNLIMTLSVTGAVTISASAVVITTAKPTWPNVMLFSSSPWFATSGAKIRNLVLSPPAPLPVSFYPASNYAVTSGFSLVQGNLLGLLSLPPVYELSFDLYPQIWPATSMSSIIHLSADNQDFTSVGSRLPAVYMCPNRVDCPQGGIYLAFENLGSNGASFMTGVAPDRKKWSTISLFVDNVNMVFASTVLGDRQSETFSSPSKTTWETVYLYASDPWNPAAGAAIRNLVVALPDPTVAPTPVPTLSPTQPTPLPSATKSPTLFPTYPPPTNSPTLDPTDMPSPLPTVVPSPLPTVPPSALPSSLPTLAPTAIPSVPPTPLPSSVPTPRPTFPDAYVVKITGQANVGSKQTVPVTLPDALLAMADEDWFLNVDMVAMPASAPIYFVVAGAAIYAGLGMLVFSLRDQSDGNFVGGEVYKLGIFPVILGTALIGSSFISECFLDQMLLFSESYKYLGFLSIVGRLIHFFAALYLLRKMRKKSHPLYQLKNTEMMINVQKSKQFIILSLFCFTDVTLIRLFPWKLSTFATHTNGLPSPNVYRVTIYSKLTQSALLIVAQLIYLAHILNPNNSSMLYSIAFLGINMGLTLVIFLVNVADAWQSSGELKSWGVWPDGAGEDGVRSNRSDTGMSRWSDRLFNNSSRTRNDTIPAIELVDNTPPRFLAANPLHSGDVIPENKSTKESAQQRALAEHFAPQLNFTSGKLQQRAAGDQDSVPAQGSLSPLHYGYGTGLRRQQERADSISAPSAFDLTRESLTEQLGTVFSGANTRRLSTVAPNIELTATTLTVDSSRDAVAPGAEPPQQKNPN